MSHYSVYVTAPDRETALAMGRTVVGERLAACANILGPVTSIYWWDGRLNEEGEVALIAKTSDSQLSALIARIKAIHPYQVPCVVAWPIAAGYEPYLDWISAETKPPS